MRVIVRRQRRRELKLVPYRHPHLKWMLAGYYLDGKRVRKFFRSKSEGQGFLQQAQVKTENLGTRALRVPGWLHEMAVEGQARLTPHGKTLKEAVDHYVASLHASERSCTVCELFESFLASKRADGASHWYLKDIRYRLRRFCLRFGKVKVSNITSAEADDWLRNLQVRSRLSGLSRNSFRRVLRTFFNYGLARGYCRENPFIKTGKAKVIDHPPEIFTVKEMEALLNAATPDILPSIAVGGLAGLRPAEIGRLDWSEVDLPRNLIHVTARKSKTATRRLVTILPSLQAWLKSSVRAQGRITPPNLREKLKAVRKRAGIKRWPQNGLRHSFASYHLAKFQDAPALALQLGHTTTAMIFGHYREVVAPEAAEAYWEIMPPLAAG